MSVQGGSVRKRSRSPVRLRNHQLGHVFLASTSEAATQVTAFSCYRQCFIEDYMRPVCFGADGDADFGYICGCSATSSTPCGAAG